MSLFIFCFGNTNGVAARAARPFLAHRGKDRYSKRRQLYIGGTPGSLGGRSRDVGDGGEKNSPLLALLSWCSREDTINSTKRNAADGDVDTEGAVLDFNEDDWMLSRESSGSAAKSSPAQAPRATEIKLGSEATLGSRPKPPTGAIRHGLHEQGVSSSSSAGARAGSPSPSVPPPPLWAASSTVSPARPREGGKTGPTARGGGGAGGVGEMVSRTAACDVVDISLSDDDDASGGTTDDRGSTRDVTAVGAVVVDDGDNEAVLAARGRDPALGRINDDSGGDERIGARSAAGTGKAEAQQSVRPDGVSGERAACGIGAGATAVTPWLSSTFFRSISRARTGSASGALDWSDRDCPAWLQEELEAGTVKTSGELLTNNALSFAGKRYHCRGTGVCRGDDTDRATAQGSIRESRSCVILWLVLVGQVDNGRATAGWCFHVLRLRLSHLHCAT